MKTTQGILTLCVIMLLISDAAFALPRFASRTGARCQTCHENPSGGGMRKEFGVTYGRETLPVPTWSNDLSLDDFSTKVTDFISFGSDFRTLFFYIQRPDTGFPPRSQAAQNAFFQMSGDLDVNFRVAKKVSLYLKKALYEDASGGFEIFGLLNLLPADGYLKIGKFIPNFGTKLDDHRAFIRAKTGFSPELARIELTGFEAAVQPGPLIISGGVYNAEDGYGVGTSNDKAGLGRAEGMFKLAENVNLSLGANVFTRKNSGLGLTTTLYGGIGSFSYKNMTVFGEADLIDGNRDVINGITVSGTKGIVSYVEADYVITPGLDLKFAYDFYDPDKDRKSGSLSSYAFGCEFFPLSGLEVRPLYRLNRESPIEIKNDEFDFLIHFYW